MIALPRIHLTIAMAMYRVHAAVTVTADSPEEAVKYVRSLMKDDSPDVHISAIFNWDQVITPLDTIPENLGKITLPTKN